MTQPEPRTKLDELIEKAEEAIKEVFFYEGASIEMIQCALEQLGKRIDSHQRAIRNMNEDAIDDDVDVSEWLGREAKWEGEET